MAYSAILIVSVFLLLAFAVERVSARLRLPSVIVLVGLGFIAKPLLGLLGRQLDGVDVLVPVLGAVGLILIVLEGAFDIELRRDRLPLATRALGTAGIGLLFYMAVFAALAMLVLDWAFFPALLLSVPFAIISSAVAIPSSQSQPAPVREFVVYESSISDILGVLVFFALMHSGGTVAGLLSGLIGGGVLSLLLSLVCSVGLVLVLMRVDGHIRFVPLLAGLFGLYAVGELLHLSPLIMVLLFGLALNNPALITRIPGLRGWMDDRYDATLDQFKVLVQELTFAVRGVFFILLGYWTELADLVAWQAWATALLALAVIYGGRRLLLAFARQAAADALLWFAPRGLITVLLFLNVQALSQSESHPPGAMSVPPLPAYFTGAVLIVVLVSTALVALARRKPQTSNIDSSP
ncbi:cation:proton antiporter domain-containing protein [Hylemonella gracilis]|uniref:Sodium/proton antiporter, cpa1 family protein n=1 Tax=Hylemonella gracilis ATCC 19624 TaxID=887062 RepID=F3KPF4_9BURK|nr:cation:proton antiporter [Hylemonella gracilis]EGI78395.1 sodium/proton antiporter, cpa1 family protein [Hylemonella gracilis ATCC 19624]